MYIDFHTIQRVAQLAMASANGDVCVQSVLSPSDAPNGGRARP